MSNKMSTEIDESCAPNQQSGFTVVAHLSGRYSAWPSWLDAPRGWNRIGAVKSREECLDDVASVWSAAISDIIAEKV